MNIIAGNIAGAVWPIQYWFKHRIQSAGCKQGHSLEIIHHYATMTQHRIFHRSLYRFSSQLQQIRKSNVVRENFAHALKSGISKQKMKKKNPKGKQSNKI